ncbi:hypothetical protein [Lysobacter panacisoli]|uniref:DUF2846 domain-containing protein n=1 Tax=Lysobacter panacisoli TaxID=1255263 RepID=A0ABP9L0J9_9GAMM|nr:hypothetical protein [Lysobacter panacisoli]
MKALALPLASLSLVALGVCAQPANPPAATQSEPSTGCGRVSVFDVAPRTRDMFRARLISIDGQLPGPAGSRSFRLDAGSHELEVAELIDTNQFDDVQLRQRDQKSGAYKKLRLDVAADTTYLLGAHLIDAHRNEILSGAYWEPVIYSQNSEPCR